MNSAEIIESYLSGAAQLRAAVLGMTREQLIARPVPGKWSTLEVVAHIADFEPIMADRIKRVISHDNPTLLGADENLFAAHLFYHERNIDEELAVVDAIRTSTARTLRQLSADSLNRVGTHSESGILTLEQLIVRATNHITHHVTFIQEKRAAAGWHW
ncbi:DinB family protein [Blastopirellula sp. JC732]|uniref:DinB family protein n=1 Tax=Blastopirellula sediminis TaxID=2894196 RepID=A0A9X1MLT4_9BACT|nr:DinB family protein [Blastopirellula sediminis]MCC9608633.1 DinB family protein [Blastopirellula sediminis]MCC9628590.1 DinB family protein [Blastopirellula sediminis]